MTSWVPSHVELTIHQARDLLLKTKSSNSVVYVCVVAERVKYYSPCLPRSSAPLWQYSARIPLMSLDTTLFCTVRQKTSLKDKFLGLVTIPLSGFTISSKSVTHWYKLGPKPGKTSSKLRGELLLSVKFLSNWVAKEPEALDFVFGSKDKNKLNEVKSTKASLAFHRKSMLKRTKSETKAEGATVASGNEGEGEKSSKTKKEKSGLFRLSIKKKTRSPALEACDDEFTSLSLPNKMDSPTSPPSVNQPREAREGDIFDGKASLPEHLSRSLDPKYLPNGRLPPPGTVQGVEGGEGEEGGRGGMAGSTVTDVKEAQTEKMSPALKYHNFRRKKRPWSMHSIPIGPQFQTEDTEHDTKESVVGSGAEGVSTSDIVTYRAKSSLVRGARRGSGVGRSSWMTAENRHGDAVNVDHDSSSGSDSNQSTPTHSPLLGSTAALRSSDRTTDRSRTSGMGNISRSSTLPASIRQRSQSMSGTITTHRGRGGTKPTLPGARVDSDTQQDMSRMKLMGLGPRVPLATSRTDSPRRGSLTNHTAHLVSGEVMSKTSVTARVPPVRNPSPVQVEPALIEEDEDGGREGEGRGSMTPEGSPVRCRVGHVVKSRVPIETESAAFRVDARELQGVILEANPRQNVSKSIVATAWTKQQRSVSLPGSPSRSPVRQKTNERLTVAQISPRKHPNLPETLTTSHLQRSNVRAQSASPIVARQGGDPCLSERSVLMALAESGAADAQARSNGTGIKHTVSFKEKSTQDYEPIPALPPCMARSQTLPRHFELTRRYSELDRPISTLDGPNSMQSGPISAQALRIPRQDPGLHNIRTFDPRLFNLPRPSQSQAQPKIAVTNASFDDTDSPSTAPVPSPTPKSPPSEMTPPSVTPDRPAPSPPPPQASRSHPGTPTPSQERGRGRRGGGLHGAMSRYQENRRKGKQISQKSLDNTGRISPAPSPDVTGDPVSISAGNSPKLLRKAATHLGHTSQPPERGWRNPFSNLRRTQSYKITAASDGPTHPQTKEVVNSSGLQGSTREPDCVSSESLGYVDTHQHQSNLDIKSSNTNDEQCGLQTVATPTSLTSDNDSIRTFGSERTLVDASGTVDSLSLKGLLNLQQSSHKQTCSSIDSEGLGSLASEEIEEAGPQEWAQWSKDELVKELTLSKKKLHSTEEELKAVRGYLDNLLLRIMETNPGILGVGNL